MLLPFFLIFLIGYILTLSLPLLDILIVLLILGSILGYLIYKVLYRLVMIKKIFKIPLENLRRRKHVCILTSNNRWMQKTFLNYKAKRRKFPKDAIKRIGDVIILDLNMIKTIKLHM